MKELLAHRDFATGLAHRLVEDQHAAEDVVQQAWLRAIQSPPEDDRALRGWIARVVVNIARSRHRARERRERAEHLARVPEEIGDGLELDAAELREQLERALLRLGARQREAIHLRYYDGLPPREIARRLHVPLETVYTRLQRGLRDLRRELAPRRGPEGRMRPSTRRKVP